VENSIMKLNIEYSTALCVFIIMSLGKELHRSWTNLKTPTLLLLRYTEILLNV